MAEETSAPLKWSVEPDDMGYYYAMHRVGQLNIRWERGAYRAYTNGARMIQSWARLEDAKRAVETAADKLPSF